MQVGDLFVALGFKVDDKGAKDFDGKIQSITKNAAKMAAVVTAAVYAVDRFVQSTTRASIALGNFAIQTGLSTQKLQQWQFAATMANTAMSAENAEQSIRGLSQALMEIRMGQGNPEAFRWLGVNPMGKDAFQVLTELSKTVKDLDPAFASMMLNQIGLSEEWVNVLTQGEDALREMFEKAPQRSNAYIKTMETIGRLSKEFRLNMQLFFEKIVVQGMPLVRSFYGFLERGVRSLSGIVDLAFSVGREMQALWQNLPEGLKLLVSAIALLRLPLVLLLGLLDDFATWMRGGDSLFGGVYDFIDKLTDKIVEFLQAAIKMGKGMWGMYRSQGNVAPDQYSKEREELEQHLGLNEQDNDFAIDQGGVKFIERGGQVIPIPPPPPPLPMPPLPAGLTQNINVYGNGDPEATANAVIGQSQRSLNHAYSDQRGGMAR